MSPKTMGRHFANARRSAKKDIQYQNWNQNSKDGKLLDKLISSGKITPQMNADVVIQLYPQFGKYGSLKLRGALQRSRSRLGNYVGKGNKKKCVDLVSTKDDAEEDEDEDDPMALEENKGAGISFVFNDPSLSTN